MQSIYWKNFFSSYYKKSFEIIDISFYQDDYNCFNAYYDNKNINAQVIYLNNDKCEKDMAALVKDIGRIDLSEHGMQGRDYLNFDVFDWKL